MGWVMQVATPAGGATIMNNKATTVEVVLTQEENHFLTIAAKSKNTTKAAILKRALRLEALLVVIRDEGGEVYIKNQDGTTSKLVLKE